MTTSSRRIFTAGQSLDVAHALTIGRLRDENAAQRARIRLLEGCLGLRPGEGIKPLQRSSWLARLRRRKEG